MNRPTFISELDWSQLQLKHKNLKHAIKKIKKNYPIQYLIGDVDFYGYTFIVNKHVLIPRFETETLIEKTIEYLKKYNLTDTNCLDIGTGTGCIPITLKKELPDLCITSIDKSGSAIKVAEKNAKLNKADVTFIKKNMKFYRPINKYGLIISNPPYITKKDEVSENIKYEPKSAIYAIDNGLYYYKIILKNSKKYILDKSILAFEIGDKQGKELKKLALSYYPDAIVKVEKDLAGKDRYLFIINE